ncbi:hypothetical protein M5K25_020254 [Dendrobium thyrsiflorum]|uniref:Uncharacterized protein n=1 Tax=Dendrobium thyrsiflorum TaxID=117978 RepID=A0ABD0U9F1_DENTH
MIVIKKFDFEIKINIPLTHVMDSSKLDKISASLQSCACMLDGLLEIFSPTKIGVSMAAKKVGVLEERLKGEMSQMKATVEDRISSVEDKISDLHEMVKKILENQNQTIASETRGPIVRNANSEICRRENDEEIIEERGGRPLEAVYQKTSKIWACVTWKEKNRVAINNRAYSNALRLEGLDGGDKDLKAAAHDGDGGTVLPELHGDVEADTGSASCHERYLPLENVLFERRLHCHPARCSSWTGSVDYSGTGCL